MSAGATARLLLGWMRARRSAPRPGFAALTLVLVLGLLALRWFVAEPFRVPSDSMLPTLRAGDHVLVDTLGYRVRRGDLFVFTAPRRGEILLKRVVALAGGTVAIEDSALYVDGARKVEAYAPPKAIDSVYFGPVRVPPGSVFTLGDHRFDSLDSRAFGPVPMGNLIGRVIARIWPRR